MRNLEHNNNWYNTSNSYDLLGCKPVRYLNIHFWWFLEIVAFPVTDHVPTWICGSDDTIFFSI